LQKPGWNLSRVLSDPCSERYRTLSQRCVVTLDIQRWMARLTQRKLDLRPPDLRANNLQVYSELSVRIEPMKNQVRWQVALNELDQLKAVAQTVATSPAQ
jgi:hypothetical protein